MVKQPSDPPPPDDAASISAELQAVFGRNLRAARMERDLTQQQLADMAGFKHQFVSRAESGHCNLTIGTMTRLAAVVGQDVSELLRLPDTDNVNPDESKPPG